MRALLFLLAACCTTCVAPPPAAPDASDVDAGPNDGGAPVDGGGAFTRFTTCGDPSCAGFTAPSGVPLCGEETEGAACPVENERCAIPNDDCNTQLLCTDEDPKAQPGGCPISVPEVKNDVRAVDDAQRRAIAGEVLAMPLYTWTYRDDRTATPRLGFLIDEDSAPFTVLPNGRHVDVYGFASAAVATLQVQQREIDALRAELAAVREELSRRRR